MILSVRFRTVGLQTPVPFKVAIYNEEKTRLRQKTARITGQSVSDVPPVYEWVYRPEMQFSLFELKKQSLKLTSNDASVQVLDLTDENAPDAALSELSYVDLFYDLLTSGDDPLTRFGTDRELVFAFGEEEVLATFGTDRNIRFYNPEHLASLSSVDMLTVSLYQSSDEANVLWEYTFAGLEVRSSANLGSREAKSFLIKTDEQAIEVEYLGQLLSTDKLAWEVEALRGNIADDDLMSDPVDRPLAYGQTVDHEVGETKTTLSPANAINTNKGVYLKPWQSQEYASVSAKVLSFKPDMTGVEHLPEKYGDGICTSGQYSDCLKGTNMGDIYRHNPQVGYKVTAWLNGVSVLSTQVKMDEVDALRQEYVSHITSVIKAGKSTAGLTVPDRDMFVNANTLPGGKGAWVEVLTGTDSFYNYPYDIILNDGSVKMWNSVSSKFEVYRQNKYNNKVVPSNLLRPSSAYRNPERNERVGGKANSLHMLGRALDVAAENLTALSLVDRGTLFGSLWSMVEAEGSIFAKADDWQLEIGATILLNRGATIVIDITTDKNNNMIHDSFEEADHVHLEDEL